MKSFIITYIVPSTELQKTHGQLWFTSGTQYKLAHSKNCILILRLFPLLFRCTSLSFIYSCNDFYLDFFFVFALTTPLVCCVRKEQLRESLLEGYIEFTSRVILAPKRLWACYNEGRNFKKMQLCVFCAHIWTCEFVKDHFLTNLRLRYIVVPMHKKFLHVWKSLVPANIICTGVLQFYKVSDVETQISYSCLWHWSYTYESRGMSANLLS